MNERATAFLKAKFYSGQITGEELMRRVEAEVRRDIAVGIEQLRGERDETASALTAARSELAQWRDCAGKLAENIEWVAFVYAETPTAAVNPEFEASPVSKARVRSMQSALTAYRALTSDAAQQSSTPPIK